MAFGNTSSSSVHSMACAVLVALLVMPSHITSTYAEIGKMECSHVDYLCFYHLDQCDAMCKAKASAKGSPCYKTICGDAPVPDWLRQCCCITEPPEPPPRRS